ncbi:hypothetical protein HanOQP8_Chr09g0315891 [Helianthus annuus]|nr:hypothetical protein HanOQP8_Chr09g0315891 [Helianthus annuus]
MITRVLQTARVNRVCTIRRIKETLAHFSRPESLSSTAAPSTR